MALGESEAARLLELGSATLGEAGASTMRSRIRPVWPGARVAGTAFTARCAPGDNLAIHVAVAEAPPGSVLVVEITGDPELGHWGEVLTTGARARGIVGLVIDGGVRDVAALEAHGFPVFSTMVALRGATKTEPGTIGGTVQAGDATVDTGDVVVGDVDGVVVIPRGRFGEVVDAAVTRARREQELFAALEQGETTVELLGLDPDRIQREQLP